jgi:glucose/mannose-6-phosphate isomerase
MAPKPLSGFERMQALAKQLPQQIREGFHAGRGVDAPIPADVRRAVLVGMGGSAIAGDLAIVLTDPETELTLSVVRAPELPRHASGDTMCLVASYSGDTWETLAAYEEAGRRRLNRIVLTSGGKLAERAVEDGVPALLLPQGGPPRAWVGFMLGGLLGLLDPVFPESNEDRLGSAAAGTESKLAALSSPKGPPARWAQAIGQRRPAIYADVAFAGLARRWKTQIEENAKRGAEFDVLPELFHNALVAWDAATPAEGRGRAVVQLEWSEAAETTRERHAYLAKVLTARKVPVLRVPLPESDRLHALVLGLALGDAVSLALARQASVDPYPVEAITRMKETLERRGPAGARGASRRARPKSTS